MSLPWCESCENKSKKGYINTVCLKCKYQYVGQDCFERKKDCFKDNGNIALQTPNEYFGDALEWIGVEII